jgi:hypothetical protein
MSGAAVYQMVCLGPQTRPEDFARVSCHRPFFGYTCTNTRAELTNDTYQPDGLARFGKACDHSQAQIITRAFGPKAASEHLVGLETL